MTIPEIKKGMSEREFLNDIKVTRLIQIVDCWHDGYLMILKNPVKIEKKLFKKIFISYFDTPLDGKEWVIRGIKYKHIADERVSLQADGSEMIKNFIKE